MSPSSTLDLFALFLLSLEEVAMFLEEDDNTGTETATAAAFGLLFAPANRFLDVGDLGGRECVL